MRVIGGSQLLLRIPACIHSTKIFEMSYEEIVLSTAKPTAQPNAILAASCH